MYTNESERWHQNKYKYHLYYTQMEYINSAIILE